LPGIPPKSFLFFVLLVLEGEGKPAVGAVEHWEQSTIGCGQGGGAREWRLKKGVSGGDLALLKVVKERGAQAGLS